MCENSSIKSLEKNLSLFIHIQSQQSNIHIYDGESIFNHLSTFSLKCGEKNYIYILPNHF